MAEPEPICPLCKHPVKRHCPDTNTTCTWSRCTLCDAIIDRRRRRGIRRNQPFTWPETQAS